MLCGEKNRMRVKDKVYKAVVRPGMMNEGETWPLKRRFVKKMNT